MGEQAVAPVAHAGSQLNSQPAIHITMGPEANSIHNPGVIHITMCRKPAQFTTQGNSYHPAWRPRGTSPVLHLPGDFMVMVLFRMLRFLGATATLAPRAPWRHKRQVELPSARRHTGTRVETLAPPHAHARMPWPRHHCPWPMAYSPAMAQRAPI